MKALSLVAALFAVAISLGCEDNQIGPARRDQALELAKTVAVLEKEISTLKGEIAAFRLAERSDPTEPSACVDIAADTYQDLGRLWQVTGLRLLNHAQGAELRGRALSRLYLFRQNVSISASLAIEGRSVGSGVIRSVRPGRYSDFSIVINTKSEIKGVERACLSINEGTGTTSGIE